MKISISIEEAALTLVAICLLTHHNLGISVWWWLLLFFSPDISMLGYLVNTRVGAATYNLFHHRAIAIIIAGLGYYFHNEIATATGILLFAHSSFDRMLGYGLKYPDAFKHTHLGWLPGKANN